MIWRSLLVLLSLIASSAFASPQIQNLDMQGYRIERLGDGSATTDAATVGQTPNRGGWIFANATWTYNSATVINTPSGNGSIFMPGTRIRLVQNSTTKMFIVVSRTDTTVTLTGGSDYTLTNDPITDNYYSHDPVPALFPYWFNWSPTLGGFSSNPSGAVYRFSVVGRKLTLVVRQPNSGTSNATTLTMTAPIAASAITSNAWSGFGNGTNNGSGLTTAVMATIDSGSTTINFYTTPGFAAWTASSTKSVRVLTLEYEI